MSGPVRTTRAPLAAASSGEPHDDDLIDLPLESLANEVEKIARFIDAVRAKQSARINEWPVEEADELAVKAQAIYRFRRRRDRAFDDGLFADPSWDILLDLFIAGKQGQRVSVSSACVSSAAHDSAAPPQHA